MQEHKIRKYWLFTNNYLVIHKRYYSSKEKALDALTKIINKSIPIYKEHLKGASSEEKRNNIINRKVREEDLLKLKEENANIALEVDKKELRPFAPRTTYQDKYSSFKNFTKDELGVSIKLLDLHMEKELMEKLYRERK